MIFGSYSKYVNDMDSMECLYSHKSKLDVPSVKRHI